MSQPEANKPAVPSQPTDVTIDAPPSLASSYSPGSPGSPASIDRFTILRRLGEGGMGDVFLARHPVTGMEVALKRLKPDLVSDPQAVHRFLVEARHMYHLNHPAILRIMEVLDPPAGPYYVMPYMPDGSLSLKLRAGQPADYVLTMRVARDVASALVYAHGKGIIHRDLKPGNVLMDSDGRAFLGDFGLVRTLFNDSVTDIRQSQTLGTAAYMSPAVARGEAEDTRCDIYSFGALLYELLTGHAPYQGRSGHEIIGKVVAGPPRPILKYNPHAPGGLVKIAEGCMARELRDRYAKMDDVLADINRVEKGKAPLGPHGKERRGLSKVVLASVTAVLVVAVGGVGAWMKYGGKAWVAVTPQTHSGDGAGLFVSQSVTFPAPATAPVIVAANAPSRPSVRPAVVLPESSVDLATLPAPQPVVSGRPVDLMRFIDLEKDAVGDGKWTKNANDELVSDDRPFSRISIPYAPPSEYDFRVEFTRTGGEQDVIQGVTAGPLQASLLIGAQKNHAFCFDHGNDNIAWSADSVLKNGVRYTSTVRVRRSGITADIEGPDGKRSVVAPSNALIRPGLAFDPRGLSVGSYVSPTTFHNIELLEITGSGTPLKRPEDAGFLDLLKNGSFTEGAGTPAEWHTIADDGTCRMARDTMEFRSAPASVRVDFQSARNPNLNRGSYVGISQSFRPPARGGLYITGLYKTDGEVSGTSYVRLWNTTNQYKPVYLSPSARWRKFAAFVPLPIASSDGAVEFELMLTGSGTVWFDDLHVLHIPIAQPKRDQPSLLSTLQTPANGVVRRMAFRKDGKFSGKLLAAGKGVTRLWDVNRGEEVLKWTGEGGSDLTPDGRFSANDKVVHDVDTDQAFPIKVQGFFYPRLTPDGRQVVMSELAAAKTTFQIFDVGTGEQVKDFGHGINADRSGFAIDGRFFVADDFKGNVVVYDAHEWRHLASQDGTADGQPHQHGSLSADGQNVLLEDDGDPDKAVVLWNWKTNHKTVLSLGKPRPRGEISPDCNWAAAYDSTDGVRLWDVAAGKITQAIAADARCFYASALAFSPDSSRLLVGYDPGMLILYDVESGKELAEFFGEQGAIGQIAFAPDGRLAAASYPAEGDIIRVWKMP